MTVYRILTINLRKDIYRGVVLGALRAQRMWWLFGHVWFITHCAGCYLPVICQWLCPEWSFLFLSSFFWTQYQTLNTIIYLVHCIDILIYSPHFSSILNDLWRGGEAKLLSAMAKWQITGTHQLSFLAMAVQNSVTSVHIAHFLSSILY